MNNAIPAPNNMDIWEATWWFLTHGGDAQFALLSLIPVLTLFGVGFILKSPSGRRRRNWPASRTLQHIDIFFTRRLGLNAPYATELVSGFAHALPYYAFVAWALGIYLPTELRILIQPLAALVGLCLLVVYFLHGHLRTTLIKACHRQRKRWAQ